MHSVTVCGIGYVGLVTSACLSRAGHDVVAYDTDVTKISQLQHGRLPIYEPNLRELVEAQCASGRLRFTASAAEAFEACDVVFIAVGTPTTRLGDADLTYVRQAARDIAQRAVGEVVVVNKSTVPVETVDLVARLLEREGTGRARFAVASNPEFLREGSAVEDFLHPDRIVIGTDDERAAALLRDLYAEIDAPVLVVDPHTAEMVKYAANAFLAAKISFVNEIASLCDAVGADVEGVLAGMALDHRIGEQYMRPGLGFGGSCLPKDVSALAHAAREHAIEPTLMDAVLDVNRRQVPRLIRKIRSVAGEIEGTRTGVLGLAFKAGTDDVRESPSVALIEELLACGSSVSVHDPAAMPNARRTLGDRVEYAADPYDALRGAHVAIVATEWPEYRALDWRRAATLMAGTAVFDPRAALDSASLAGTNLIYIGSAHDAPGVSV